MKNNSLIKRIITTFALGPLILIFLFYTNFLCFFLFSSFILILAVLEWQNFFKIKGRYLKTAVLALSSLSINIYFFFRVEQQHFFLVWHYLLFITFFWLLVPFLFYVHSKDKCQRFSDEIIWLIGLLLFTTTSLSWNILFIKISHALLFIYLLLLIWVADSFAFFSGMKYGKHKLVPKISPGKTWEGVFGAFLFTCVYSFAFSYLFLPKPYHSFFFLLASMFSVFISIIGDLFISLLKRQNQLKDSGNLLPGHGGILDRIDSLLSASPVFVVCLWLLGWFSNV